MKLGVLDSGLGGLSVVRALREQLPQHPILFFADQAHVPYGERTEENLVELFAENVRWLNSQKVDLIVMGCNTSCAMGRKYGWPQSEAPILDLVESAATAAAPFSHIGVVATSATVRSGAYSQALRAQNPHAEVVEVAAPALVPLVEGGKAGTQEAHAAVAKVCAALPKSLDALILGCTHYPLLDAHFGDALPEGVTRIDPALQQAKRARELVTNGDATPLADVEYVTNGDLGLFELGVRAVTGEFAPNVYALERYDFKGPKEKRN